MIPTKLEILLGSQSPRRKQILEEMNLKFKVVSIDTDENFENIPAIEVAKYLAKKKSLAYKDLINGQLLITADTTVICDNLVLNKPGNEAHAKEMLLQLSNKMHQVITGVAVRTTEKFLSFSDTTEVYVNTLTEKTINFYVEEYKPFDKAGAYGIQEWFGHTQISKIIGSYTNVMGLPSESLFKTLQNWH